MEKRPQESLAKVNSAGLVIAVLTSGDIYPIFLVGFFILVLPIKFFLV